MAPWKTYDPHSRVRNKECSEEKDGAQRGNVKATRAQCRKKTFSRDKGLIMGISFRHRGSFKNTEKFLKKAEKVDFYSKLEQYGKEGVAALMSATPIDSGETAMAWDYEIHLTKEDCAIYWINTNVNKGVNIAIILQYGHGTGTGGYVKGYDYINPAIIPVFDRIADAVWREVVNA